MVYTCWDVWPDACMMCVLRSSNNNCSQLGRIGEKKAPHRVILMGVQTIITPAAAEWKTKQHRAKRRRLLTSSRNSGGRARRQLVLVSDVFATLLSLLRDETARTDER